MNAEYAWVEGRPVARVDSLGINAFLTDWLVLDPFPFELPGGLNRELWIGRADAVDADPTGVERTVRPREGDKQRNDAVAGGFSVWQRLIGSTVHDLKSRYPGFSSALVYAATYLHADTDTILAFCIDDWEIYRSCTAQLLLDGVEVCFGPSPAVVRIPAGTHCLIAKIGGGSGSGFAWKLSVRAGRVETTPAGWGVSLARLPGFWRGEECAPEVEVDVVLVNPTGSPLEAGKIAANLCGQTQGAPSENHFLDPWQAKAIRISAPLGACSPESTTTVELAFYGRTVAFPVTVPRLLPPCTIHVLEGFHCDPVWVSDQRHYNLISLENVKMQVDACLVDPGYRAFVHELDYLKSFVDEYPDYRAKVFELVASGQLIVGSSYSEPNENNISGEAIIRNIIYGQGYHRHFLGGDPRVYHAWDVFGHIPQLSQILARSGHRAALWSKSILGFPPLFRHMSLDGTVLPHIRTHYTWYSNSLDNLRTISEPVVREKQSFGWHRHLMVEASDFTPPSAWMIGRTAEMAASYPRILMTGPEEFLDGLTADGARLPLTSRNPSQHHVGTFHTRVELKLANRLAENMLFAAEIWSTFSGILGAEYPDHLIDKAWRQLLFGQHHDAITGTPCDVSYLDLMAGYREALRLARGVLEDATTYIADAVTVSRDGTSVVAFNPLAWERDGVITIQKPEGFEGIEVRNQDGTSLPCFANETTVEILAKKIPSVGYSTLDLLPAPARSEPTVTRCDVLENEYWRMELDPARGGGIVSLFDKEQGKEIVDSALGVGNDLLALGNGPNPWEFHTTGERVAASDSPAVVEVHTTPTSQTAVVSGRLGEICSYRRTLTLRPGSRTIEASVVLSGYRANGHQFVATFPTALQGALPIFEDKFGSVVARRGKVRYDYRTSGSHRASDCAIFPVYNWVEAGWSATAEVPGTGAEGRLNIGMMGIIIPHDSAVEDAAEPLLKALNRVGVTSTFYFDDDDEPRKKELDLNGYGELFYHHLSDDTTQERVRDLAMAAQWMAVSVAGENAYVEQLLARLPGEVSRSLSAQRDTGGWGVVLVEDDRVPEAWGTMPVIVISAVSREAAASAFRAISQSLDTSSSIRLPAGTDFRTTKTPLDDYGFAVLTSGTGAATMEPDGTLTLFLGRTSDWAQKNMIGREINPERRDMAFHYGFYGHAGSWRDGNVVRAGYEFNNPLTAVVPSRSTVARLPKTQSFLSLTGTGAVVTAVKPAGNPLARFENTPSDPRNGIVVRAYEALGRSERIELRLFSGIARASETDLVENDVTSVPVDGGAVARELAPFSINTFRVIPVEKDRSGGVQPSVRDWRPDHVVWCRYYQHNVGAHPTGYLPVGIYIDGELPIENRGGQFPTVGRCRVWIVNNSTDRAIYGTARLLAPDHWTLHPAEIPYELGPREHVTTEVVVAFDCRPRVGMIKARMEYDGVVYQDVLEAGFKTVSRGVATERGAVRYNGWEVVKEREPEWTVLRNAEDIIVRIRNPWLQPLEAEVAVISPMEMWGRDAGSYGLCALEPDTAAMTLRPRETREIRFRVSVGEKPSPTFWAWAKLMCNGKCAYLPVPGTTA